MSPPTQNIAPKTNKKTRRTYANWTRSREIAQATNTETTTEPLALQQPHHPPPPQQFKKKNKKNHHPS